MDIEKVNINSLFAELITNFNFLLTRKKQTKAEFLQNIKDTYNVANPKTALFYQACERSEFKTVRLNLTKQSILFNQ